MSKLCYKGRGKSVFVIFGGRVRTASVIGTNSDKRGVVVGNKIKIPSRETDDFGGATLPMVTNFLMKDIFEDEEIASKALFTRKLKGEI